MKSYTECKTVSDFTQYWSKATKTELRTNLRMVASRVIDARSRNEGVALMNLLFLHNICRSS
jgi:hypothetical protein